MKRRASIGLITAGFGLLALLGSGCTSRDETSTPGGAAAKVPGQPVVLPDLSGLTEATRAQITAQHSTLRQRMLAPNPQRGELSEAYGEMGRLLMAAGYHEAAEPCFLNAQALMPGEFRWVYYLGHVYRDRGDAPKAMAWFGQALMLRPDDLAALVWLGDLELAQGRPDEAEPRFARALALQPGSLSARFGLGRTALAKQDYALAVKYLEGILAADREAAAAHYPLAMAYRGLGRTDLADRHFRQREDHEILPADPLMVELQELIESPQAYEARGIRALDRKAWPEAAALFRKGLELAPTNPALRQRLGSTLYQMGDARGARAAFEEVVRVTPGHALAQYSLGVLLQADGRHADAIERFRAALQSRPGHVDSHLRLAASLRRLGRAEASLPHYEQVMSLNPDLVEARFGQAVALVQIRRYAEARDRLVDAAKAYPDQPVFAHGLARLLASADDDRVRDGSRALALVQELLKHGRTLDLGATLAMALAASGEFARAAAVQRDLITAAEKAGLTTLRASLAANLVLYERGEPCRTPWTADEMP